MLFTRIKKKVKKYEREEIHSEKSRVRSAKSKKKNKGERK